MKRTVTANISGIVFHVEENAYRKLETYLKKLREHLSDEEGTEEILEDIEARIAELFKERTKGPKEVVTEADVDEVISIMGYPEDLSGEEGSEEGGSPGEEQKSKEKQEKRVYRNPDDKVLGGVCSGISAYLGWDPLWLRLGFILATLLVGTGPLLYIILWVIIPEAHTRTEKLHMRGETVDLDNLKRRMKEEGEEIKDRFGRIKEEVQSEEVKGQGRKLGQRLKEVGQGILYWLGKGAEKIGGIFLIFFGLILGLIAFIALAGGGDHFIFLHSPEGDYTFHALLSGTIGNSIHLFAFKTAFGLTFGIPMFCFLYWGSKALIGSKHRLGWFGNFLLVLWLIGLVTCVYLGLYWDFGHCWPS